MSHWNYRLVRQHHKDEVEVLLVECYYGDKGDPRAYTAGGCGFGGESVAEVREAVTAALLAFDKPVLEEKDFRRSVASEE